jgi:uncharacterized protein (DUF4415 family)
MSESNMGKASETDWKRLSEMSDEEIDTSDIPPLEDSFFANAEMRVPKQVSVTMRVDSDLLNWFKKQGEEYESLINTALRSYVEEHKEQHS